ncbi:MAG: hypothetical protein AB8B91_02050 [Rubripirellula sp.]
MSQATHEGTRSLLTINRWFVWKEMRQLSVLVIALLFAAVITLLFLAGAGSQSSWIHETPIVVLMFPILYALGAGTVLVGQEREHRTLHWLSTLPIPHHQLLGTKVGTATVGLIVMWFLAVCTLWLTGILEDESPWGLNARSNYHDLAPISYPLWMTHSLYVMLCGFFASWKFKNPFVAIVVVLPLSLIPIVIAELGLEFAQSNHYASFVHLVWILSSAISIPVMGLLAHRVAHKALSADKPPQIRVVSLKPRESETVLAQTTVFRWPMAAFIWQSIRSSAIPLAILATSTIVSMLAAVSWLTAKDMRYGEAKLVGWIMLLSLSISWLGVLVFKFDGSAARLRFVADRGVSPTKVFFARHGVPMAIIATMLVGYTIIITLRTDDQHFRILPSTLALALYVALFYSISQWVSQLTKMLTVALIVAPLASTLVINWWLNTVVNMESAWWMLGIFILLPMLATWRRMLPYMDMRGQIRTWIIAIGVALLIITLPVIPAVWKVSSFLSSHPNVTRNTLELLEAGNAVVKQSPRSIVLEMDNRDPLVGVFRETPELGARISAKNFGILFPELMLSRTEFLHSLRDAETPNEQAIEAYAKTIETASIIGHAARQSNRWFDQEAADRIEIWLVDALLSEEMQPYQQEPFFTAAVKRLVSSKARLKFRHDAVQESYSDTFRQDAWLNSRTSRFNQLLWETGHELPFGISVSRYSILFPIALKASTESPPADWLQQMHQGIFGDRPIENGPYGSRLRNQPAIMSVTSEILYPARYWGMEWEVDAETLRSSFGDSK